MGLQNQWYPVGVIPPVCLEGKVWKRRAKYQGHCVVGERIYEYIRTTPPPHHHIYLPEITREIQQVSTAVTDDSILHVTKGIVNLEDSCTADIKVSLIPSENYLAICYKGHK